MRGGKAIADITFDRTPTDGSQPSSKVHLNTSLKTERELISALMSALIRVVDKHGPTGNEVVIELGADDN